VTKSIGRPLLVRHARYRWDALRQQHQLVFPEGLLALNESAAAVVQLCDGRPLADLFAVLGERFPAAALEADVLELLDQLTRKGLLRDAADA
jgi:pyrroloquinoline quinone biosynthesis protein D